MWGIWPGSARKGGTFGPWLIDPYQKGGPVRPHSLKRTPPLAGLDALTARVPADKAQGAGRVFSRHLLAYAREAPQLYRSPLRCDPPSKPTSNLSPAAALLQRRLALAHPCSRRANLMIRTCLLAQGWRSTSTRSILITRSSCLVLQVRPRSDLVRLGAAVVSAAGWCSRAASSRATSSPPPTTITGSLGNSTS